MWKDPSDPQWTEDIHFPMGTMVYKIIFSNATDDELPILKGAPAWEAVCYMYYGASKDSSNGFLFIVDCCPAY